MCFEWAHSRLRFRCDFLSPKNCLKFHAKFTKFHLISEPGTSSRMCHIYLVMIANTKLSPDGPIRLSGYLLIEATTNMLHAPSSSRVPTGMCPVPCAICIMCVCVIRRCRRSLASAPCVWCHCPVSCVRLCHSIPLKWLRCILKESHK